MTGQKTVASIVDKLNIMVFEERRTVTFKWLSRILSLPSDTAKQLLFTFSKSCAPDQLDVVFMLSGWTKGAEPRHVITLVAAKDLPGAKGSLDPVSALHVYSVRPAIPSTPADDEHSDGKVHEHTTNGDVDMDGEGGADNNSAAATPSGASKASALAHTLSLVVAEDLGERLHAFNKLAGEGASGPLWDNRFSSVSCDQVQRAKAGRPAGACQTAPAVSPVVTAASGRSSVGTHPGSKADTMPTLPSKQAAQTEAAKASMNTAVTGDKEGGAEAARGAAAKSAEAAQKEGSKATPATAGANNKNAKAGAAKAAPAPAPAPAAKKNHLASMWASAGPAKAKPVAAAPSGRAAAPSSAEALIRAQEAADDEEDEEDEEFVRPAQRAASGRANGGAARSNRRHVLLDEEEEEEVDEEEDGKGGRAEDAGPDQPIGRGQMSDVAMEGAGGGKPSAATAAHEDAAMDVDTDPGTAAGQDAVEERADGKPVTDMEDEEQEQEGGSSQNKGEGMASQDEGASDNIPLAQASQGGSQGSGRGTHASPQVPSPVATRKRKVVTETFIDDKGNEVTRVVEEGGLASPEKKGPASKAPPPMSSPAKTSGPPPAKEEAVKKVTPKAAEPRKPAAAVTPKQAPAKKAAPPAKPGPKQGSITSFFSKKPA
eukprot:jgi/Mesvir1/3222/Mv16371-RA.1